MKSFLLFIFVVFSLAGCVISDQPPSSMPNQQQSVVPEQKCSTDTDCQKLNLAAPFCDQGAWRCLGDICSLSCDISDKL